MDIRLKVTELLFDEILNDGKKVLRHGFSKNKKYTRLFVNDIENIAIYTIQSDRVMIRRFSSIKTIEINGKKIIEITIL